ncbi:unnamed protein product [Dovyalis caffra]|uniref:Uncharacterized protein n=1 Tax=Dovyalis caffra TaxID=77055 RepID=A0AAV1SPS7_9ROSI|nr:unnamed protein product [Dovyalis caffra]
MLDQLACLQDHILQHVHKKLEALVISIEDVENCMERVLFDVQPSEIANTYHLLSPDAIVSGPPL